MCVLSFLAES